MQHPNRSSRRTNTSPIPTTQSISPESGHEFKSQPDRNIPSPQPSQYSRGGTFYTRSHRTSPKPNVLPRDVEYSPFVMVDPDLKTPQLSFASQSRSKGRFSHRGRGTRGRQRSIGSDGDSGDTADDDGDEASSLHHGGMSCAITTSSSTTNTTNRSTLYNNQEPHRYRDRPTRSRAMKVTVRGSGDSRELKDRRTIDHGGKPRGFNSHTHHQLGYEESERNRGNNTGLTIEHVDIFHGYEYGDQSEVEDDGNINNHGGGGHGRRSGRSADVTKDDDDDDDDDYASNDDGIPIVIRGESSSEDTGYDEDEDAEVIIPVLANSVSSRQGTPLVNRTTDSSTNSLTSTGQGRRDMGMRGRESPSRSFKSQTDRDSEVGVSLLSTVRKWLRIGGNEGDDNDNNDSDRDNNVKGGNVDKGTLDSTGSSNHANNSSNNSTSTLPISEDSKQQLHLSEGTGVSSNATTAATTTTTTTTTTPRARDDSVLRSSESDLYSMTSSSNSQSIQTPLNTGSHSVYTSDRILDHRKKGDEDNGGDGGDVKCKGIHGIKGYENDGIELGVMTSGEGERKGVSTAEQKNTSVTNNNGNHNNDDNNNSSGRSPVHQGESVPVRRFRVPLASVVPPTTMLALPHQIPFASRVSKSPQGELRIDISRNVLLSVRSQIFLLAVLLLYCGSFLAPHPAELSISGTVLVFPPLLGLFIWWFISRARMRLDVVVRSYAKGSLAMVFVVTIELLFIFLYAWLGGLIFVGSDSVQKRVIAILTLSAFTIMGPLEEGIKYSMLSQPLALPTLSAPTPDSLLYHASITCGFATCQSAVLTILFSVFIYSDVVDINSTQAEHFALFYVSLYLLVFNIPLHLLAGYQMSLKLFLRRHHSAALLTLPQRWRWLYTSWYGILLPPVLMRIGFFVALNYFIAISLTWGFLAAGLHITLVGIASLLHTRSVVGLLPPLAQKGLLGHMFFRSSATDPSTRSLLSSPVSASTHTGAPTSNGNVNINVNLNDNQHHPSVSHDIPTDPNQSTSLSHPLNNEDEQDGLTTQLHRNSIPGKNSFAINTHNNETHTNEVIHPNVTNHENKEVSYPHVSDTPATLANDITLPTIPLITLSTTGTASLTHSSYSSSTPNNEGT